MKKSILFGASLLLAALSASAEGYQINTLSARQIGMGYTGTALKLGAESMIFNPAGLTSMEGNIDFSGSVSAIFSHCTVDHNATEYKNTNGASTPLAFSLGLNIYRNLKAGISFYTPYGSAISWNDNWPAAVLNQSVKLRVYTIQPTIAWEIIPGLRVGAGAMISWGAVDLNKGLVPAQSMNYILATKGIDYTFTDTPASVNLVGNARVTAGVHIGAQWDITKQLTIGFAYRQKMNMTVKSGDASVSYANEIAQSFLQSTIGVLNQANFTATMPAPAVYSFGIAYKPIDKLTLAFDAKLTGWSTYKQLEIDFLSEALTPFNQHIEKSYKNAWTFNVGGEFALTNRFDVRAGVMIDTTPVQIDHYNPETPGMTKIEPTIGFSFRPISQFSIDASLLYVAGLGRKNASCSYSDFLTGTENSFKANYSLYAWCPSIGFSFHF